MKSFRSSICIYLIFILETGILGASAQTGFKSVANETAAKPAIRKFPDGFKFGVATAAYQIEGAWNVSGKSKSIWDVYAKKPSVVADGTTADEACKSYEYYKRDIEMIKFLGVDFYRFSISWPRLFPNGFTNNLNKDGLRYYSNLIDELLENGIEPIVTMYHWDLPQNLQDLGGWTNPLIVDWFGDYARSLYTLFGDRVKTWVTINEPKQIGIYGYGMTRFAPGINMPGIADYLAVKYLLLAHARAWHVYDEEFRETQKASADHVISSLYGRLFMDHGLGTVAILESCKCAITIACDYRVGASDAPEDIEAGLYAMDFEVGLYTHPIFSTKGGFPDRVVKRVMERSLEQGFKESRLPNLTDEEIEYIKGSSDFFGMNQYSTYFFKPYKPGVYEVPSYNDDVGGVSSILDYAPGIVIHSTSIPHGFRKSLNWIRENCNDPDIMITENGFATLGGLEDEPRVENFRQYLSNMLDAIEDGCKVVAYTAWSLMDNFEWSAGLRIKFGLFEVDYEDDYRTRYARTSAFWYRQTIASHALDLDFKPENFEKLTF